MKRSALSIIFVCIAAISFGQVDTTLAIVPQPVKAIKKTGYFILPQNITIQTVETTALKQTVVDLQKRLSVPTGYKVTVSGNAPSATIKLELNKSEDATLGNEGYNLSVTANNIVIKAKI